MEIAKQLLLQQKYLEAINQYKKCLQDPINDKSIATLNIAICYINLKQYENALNYADQSIEANQLYFKAYYRKAQILMHMQQFEDALQIVKQLQSKQPSQEVATLKQQILDQYMDLSYSIKEIAECTTEKDYQRMFQGIYQRIDLMPNCISLLNEGGYCHQLLQQGEQHIYYQLKLVGFLYGKCIEQLPNIPNWLTKQLTNKFTQYVKQSKSKQHEIAQIYMTLLSRAQLDESLMLLILDNADFFLDRNLSFTSKLFILNNTYQAELQQIVQIAKYLKDADDFTIYSNQFILTIEILISLLKHNEMYFGFLKRDTFRKQDLIILIAMAGANQIGKISQCYSIQDKLLQTIKVKITKDTTIELCNQLLSLMLKEVQFCEQIISNPLCEVVTTQILEHLKEHKRQLQSNAKYLCLLFLLQSQAKHTQLHEYLFTMDCNELILELLQDEDIQLQESLALLQLISIFDDIKKILIKNKAILLKYVMYSQTWLNQQPVLLLDRIRQYHNYSSLLQIVLQLSTDQSEVSKESHKQQFEIDEQEYQNARQLQQQYGNDNSQEYLTYNASYILKHNVITYIALDLKIIAFIGEFLHKYETSVDPKLQITISTLLSHFSTHDQLIQHLFEKRGLRFVAQQCLKGNMQGLGYLSRVMKGSNPQLFDFKDAQLLAQALIHCAQVATHELHIFHCLLGVVQLSSLGECVQSKLINIDTIVTLQNLLMDSNQYIVHSSLQILNNIALHESFLQLVEKQEVNKLMEILSAIANYQCERLSNPEQPNATDFSHPCQLILTIISIFTILSQVDYFKLYIINNCNTILQQNTYITVLQFISNQDTIMESNIIKVISILYHQILYMWIQYNIKFPKLIEQTQQMIQHTTNKQPLIELINQIKQL